MSKEELKPVDLGHLQDRAVQLLDALLASRDDDRTEEYRKFMLDRAFSLAEVQVRDFRHIFDTYKIGGIVPYGIDEPSHE